jgi:hypothetical protein
MDDNRNSSDGTAAQAGLAAMDFSQLPEVAEQLQRSISRFTQEDERNQEGLLAVIKQMGAQLRTTDVKLGENRAQIEKLGSWIRNNRS